MLLLNKLYFQKFAANVDPETSTCSRDYEFHFIFTKKIGKAWILNFIDALQCFALKAKN